MPSAETRRSGQHARWAHRPEARVPTRDRFRVHKRNPIEINEEALWLSAMFAETITTSHSKLSRPERLGPLTASNARFTCWHRPVPKSGRAPSRVGDT